MRGFYANLWGQIAGICLNCGNLLKLQEFAKVPKKCENMRELKKYALWLKKLIFLHPILFILKVASWDPHQSLRDCQGIPSNIYNYYKNIFNHSNHIYRQQGWESLGVPRFDSISILGVTIRLKIIFFRFNDSRFKIDVKIYSLFNIHSIHWISESSTPVCWHESRVVDFCKKLL